MSQRGVIFQTIPEEVAQAIDHLSRHWQLPPDRVIKMGISVLVLMEQQADPRLCQMIEFVKRDHARDIDRVLA